MMRRNKRIKNSQLLKLLTLQVSQHLKVLQSVKQSIEQAQIKQKGTYDKKYASKHSFEVGSSKTLEEESEPEGSWTHFM